jgi:hypothetical protein
MVADLSLYHSEEVVEAIKAGDFDEKFAEQLSEMKNTFESRVPEEVRARKDFLQDAVDKFIEKKRKALDPDN